MLCNGGKAQKRKTKQRMDGRHRGLGEDTLQELYHLHVDRLEMENQAYDARIA